MSWDYGIKCRKDNRGGGKHTDWELMRRQVHLHHAHHNMWTLMTHAVAKTEPSFLKRFGNKKILSLGLKWLKVLKTSTLPR